MRSPMIFCVVLMLGCGGPEMSDAGTPDGGGVGLDSSTGPVCDGGLDAGPIARGLSRACSQGVVASGFTIRHGRAAHAVSRLGAFIRPEAPDGCESGTVLSRATLVTELDPGVDEGIALATYHVLGEPLPPMDAGAAWSGLRVVTGQVGINMDSAIGPSASTPVLFDLGLAGLDAAPTIVVVLNGFDIDTDVPQATGYPADHRPADGYELLAIGASVDSVTRDGVDLRFDASATLDFASSGGTAMHRAAGVARTRFTIHYAVVGLVEPPATSHVSYRGFCRPEPSVGAVSFDAAPGARVIPALSAFEFDVRPGSTEGTLVRELSVLVDGFTHDPMTGRASMNVSGFIEGAADAPLETLFDADVVLLGWMGAESVQPLRYASTVAPGHAETSLPLTP